MSDWDAASGEPCAVCGKESLQLFKVCKTCLRTTTDTYLKFKHAWVSRAKIPLQEDGMSEALVRIKLGDGSSIDMSREEAGIKLCRQDHCVILPTATGEQALQLYALLEPLGEPVFPELPPLPTLSPEGLIDNGPITG